MLKNFQQKIIKIKESLESVVNQKLVKYPKKIVVKK